MWNIYSCLRDARVIVEHIVAPFFDFLSCAVIDKMCVYHYVTAGERHSSETAVNNSQPLSDITRPTPSTYESLDENLQRPVTYQQLSAQTARPDVYYNMNA